MIHWRVPYLRGGKAKLAGSWAKIIRDIGIICALSTFPKFVALGLAATLGSQIPQHQVGYSSPGPDDPRINQLWLVTYLNEVGLEVVAEAKLTDGSYAPLIAADHARLESMMPAARNLAKSSNIKMRLIKLTDRVDIEDIAP